MCGSNLNIYHKVILTPYQFHIQDCFETKVLIRLTVSYTYRWWMRAVTAPMQTHVALITGKKKKKCLRSIQMNFTRRSRLRGRLWQLMTQSVSRNRFVSNSPPRRWHGFCQMLGTPTTSKQCQSKSQGSLCEGKENKWECDPFSSRHIRYHFRTLPPSWLGWLCCVAELAPYLMHRLSDLLGHQIWKRTRL